MARSDLLVSLVKAGTAGDRRTFQSTAEAIIAEERAKHHDVLADKLSQAIQPNGNGARAGVIAAGAGDAAGISSSVIGVSRAVRRMWSTFR
jgi:hypothetical protein